MRDKIENILFQVSSCANNAIYFSLTNHLRKRNSQFSCAHSSSKGEEHDPSIIDVLGVSVGSILECRRIEVTIMMIDELGNGSWCHFGNGIGLEILILNQRRSRIPELS